MPKSLAETLCPHGRPIGGHNCPECYEESRAANTPTEREKPRQQDGEAVLKAAENLDVKAGTPCTEFVQKSLEAAGFDLDADQKAFVNIDMAGIKRMLRRQGFERWEELPDEIPNEKLKEFVTAGYDFAKGVVLALTDRGQGEEIDISDGNSSSLEPGDIIQYWYKVGHDKVGGHSAIVKRVTSSGRVVLYGSHETDRPTAYIGEKTVNLGSSNIIQRYAVRPKAP